MISQIVAILSIASMADARMQSFLMVKGGNSVSLKEKRKAEADDGGFELSKETFDISLTEDGEEEQYKAKIIDKRKKAEGGNGVVWKVILDVEGIENPVPAVVKLPLPKPRQDIDQLKKDWADEIRMSKDLQGQGIAEMLGKAKCTKDKQHMDVLVLKLYDDDLFNLSKYTYREYDLEEKKVTDREYIFGLSVLLSLISSLESIHNKGIIHRDLKLENIFAKNPKYLYDKKSRPWAPLYAIALGDLGNAVEAKSEENADFKGTKRDSPARWIDYLGTEGGAKMTFRDDWEMLLISVQRLLRGDTPYEKKTSQDTPVHRRMDRGWKGSKSSGWKDIKENFPEDIDKARNIVCDDNYIHQRFGDLCKKLWGIIYGNKNADSMKPLPKEDVTLMKNEVINELKEIKKKDCDVQDPTVMCDVSSPEFMHEALSEWVETWPNAATA